jgi:hypothetical protein
MVQLIMVKAPTIVHAIKKVEEPEKVYSMEKRLGDRWLVKLRGLM